jgi:hypothetical protein
MIVHKPFKDGALATLNCALSTGEKLLSGLGQCGALRCVLLDWNRVSILSTRGQNSLTGCPLRKMKCPRLDALLLRANQGVHFRGRTVQAT